MSKIFGYGEDALTLWLLRTDLKTILRDNRFNDSTPLSDCLIFYRPSFGRSGGSGSAEFGEFDAILASKENVYLIESKWDNHRLVSHKEHILRPEQTLRHEVFRWYLSNWSDKYANDWKDFVKEKGANFVSGKKVAPAGSLLSMNLRHILSQLHEHCPNCANGESVKNVLLFFHSSKSNPPKMTSHEFTIVAVKYENESNYVTLS